MQPLWIMFAVGAAVGAGAVLAGSSAGVIVAAVLIYVAGGGLACHWINEHSG